MHDIFICHASEDKDVVARPLAEQLQAAGLTVWYDEFSLALGDSLRESIDKGLSGSRFGAVIISPHFIAKKWPQAELNGLFAREMSGEKTILPIWHNISQAQVLQYSPILADRKAVGTDKGLDIVLETILDTVDPTRRHRVTRGRALAISPTSIRLHTGDWEVQTPITIYNRSEDPAYAVVLKIVIHGIGVSADSVQVAADEQQPMLEVSLGDVVFSADRIMVHWTGQDGTQGIYFVLHTVPPKATRTLAMKGTAPIPSSAEITIVRFQDSPQELLIRNGQQVAVNFSLFENV
jgi:TIR domain